MKTRKRGRSGQPAGSVRTEPQPRQNRLFRALPAVLILAFGAWSYATSFTGVFVLDDVRAIVRNQTLRSLWPLPGPLSPPGRSTVAGRPVANLSFAVNYALAPDPVGTAGVGAGSSTDTAALTPAPFHAGNLLIHLAAALTLFGVVRRTLLSPVITQAFRRASTAVAFAVAVLWVGHPLTTAAVTYMVQRVESLMSLFYLLTLYATVRASEGAGRPGWWSAAAILSSALGMATKETMVTAPVVAAIWLRIFAPPSDGERWQGRRGLMAGLAATWLVLAFLVYGERRGPSVEYAWDAVWPYLLAQAQVVLHYLRLVFVPSPLVFLYDWPLVTSLGAAAWQALLLAALAAATIGGVARRHPASFLGASFFLILAPSSSILPIVTEVAAEHRMYLPLAAVIAAVVCAVFELGRRLEPPPRVAAVAAMIVVAVCAVALAAETRARNRVYWSAEGLWADTVAKRPGDMRAKVAYAEALAIAGKLPEAEAQLRAAVALAPENGVARVRLGSVLAAQGEYSEAETTLTSALALLPDDPDAHRFLGEIYAAQGRDVDAARHFERALAALPGDPRLTGRLAYLLARSPEPLVRDLPRARELVREAVRLTGGRDPRLVELLNQLDALR